MCSQGNGEWLIWNSINKVSISNISGIFIGDNIVERWIFDIVFINEKIFARVACTQSRIADFVFANSKQNRPLTHWGLFREGEDYVYDLKNQPLAPDALGFIPNMNPIVMNPARITAMIKTKLIIVC